MMNNLIITGMEIEKFVEIIDQSVAKSIDRILTPKPEKELLTKKEACDFLGIHLSTLDKWMSENKIPYQKLGKRVYFIKEDILASLQDFDIQRFKELKLSL